MSTAPIGLERQYILNITDDIAVNDKIKYLIDVFVNKLYFIYSVSKILSIQF